MEYEPMKIPLSGTMVKVKVAHMDLAKIELDEQNPRIAFYKDNQPNDQLDPVISFALQCRRPDSYEKLKKSIHSNRGITFPIWLEPTGGSEKYRVIEGNTRVVIYKELADEETNEPLWKSILAYILPGEVKEEEINFIRLPCSFKRS